MLYKRHEYFRYTFGQPLEGEFRIVVEDKQGRESSPGHCQLVDISPGGAKLFAKFNIPVENGTVHLRIKFKLLEETREVSGVIVWRKPFKDGYLYGYDFDEDAELENIIVEELKLRRRSEMNLDEV
ncbi:PilZ domain-containing protein [Sporosarcina beigongshangi]|uniref:PilZ domain-containing protein n=1 Tax=Sporosarcina beigongshangi TaxID=2782538 RepID=UPI00193A61C9|nr:PilZ domain-containing protein [Sporosarcina beigongshangi]